MAPAVTGHDFEEPVSIARPLGFCYGHEVAVTVSGTDSWTGYPEIMVKR